MPKAQFGRWKRCVLHTSFTVRYNIALFCSMPSCESLFHGHENNKEVGRTGLCQNIAKFLQFAYNLGNKAQKILAWHMKDLIWNICFRHAEHEEEVISRSSSASFFPHVFLERKINIFLSCLFLFLKVPILLSDNYCTFIKKASFGGRPDLDSLSTIP